MTRVKQAIREASEKLVLEMAIRLANQAKLLAPVDLGQLRNSISVATKNQTGIELNKHAGEKAPPLEQTGLKEAEAYVGSNVARNASRIWHDVPARPALFATSERAGARRSDSRAGDEEMECRSNEQASEV